ncbi:flagellar biosynthetic protein FliO [Paucidesulfovibrio longus]|uniref:flagellar biosynthetic protein FliO n=1 Tax=Paucidesulfovibrio longus TaxID=889 RepID=UPI0012DC3962|nr:flagellar biosynthetic protein FliO [Paucidesulfovibrio longus]
MPDATLQVIAANATQAAEQASQATSALAESAALNATSLAPPASAASSGVGQALGATSHAAAPAANATGSLPGMSPPLLDPSAAHTGALGTVDPSTTGSMIDASHSLLGTTLVTAAYLCLILGVIFLAVWLLRRYGPASVSRTKGPDNPRLIGRLMLGPKQSVCVVRVHERNLILGVTEQRINLLAETDTPAGRCYEDEDEDDFTRFAEELAEKRKDAADGA